MAASLRTKGTVDNTTYLDYLTVWHYNNSIGVRQYSDIKTKIQELYTVFTPTGDRTTLRTQPPLTISVKVEVSKKLTG